LKREIPRDWEVKSLSDLTGVSTDQLNPMLEPHKEFKHYSIPAYDELGTYKTERGEEIKSNKFVVLKTDLLVSKLNPWFSRIIYPTDEQDLICSTEFVVWRAKSIPLKNYLYMIARDKAFISYCTKSATGTSNSHKRVNPTVMMKYKVAYNDKVAEQFGEHSSSVIKMYAKNQAENERLSRLRNWLLPMLMNGQVKVN
jgi:type I restriction enzyme S subunit